MVNGLVEYVPIIRCTGLQVNINLPVLKIGPRSIGKVVENLLQTQTLVVQLAETAWKALAAYRKGVADYADCLIERLGAANQCDATYIFDKVAARDAGMQFLSSR